MDQILRLPSMELTVDYNRKLLKVSFIGDVKFPEYKQTLLEAAEQVRSHGVEQVILDRTKIEKVDAECRVWAKNEYVKVHIKPLIPKLTKVAVVDTKSIVGQLYGKAIYQTLSIIYPSLTFKFFGKLENAIKWLQPTSSREALPAGIKDRPAQESRKKVTHKTNNSKSPQSTVVGTVEDATSKGEAVEKAQASLFEKFLNALFSRSN